MAYTSHYLYMAKICYYVGMIEPTPAELTIEKPKKKKGAARIYEQVEKEKQAELLAAGVQDVTKPFIPYSEVARALYGRPPKYDEKKHPQMIYEKMAPPYCLPKEAAALALGISWRTVYDWMDKHDTFSQAVRAAEFISEAYHGGRLASGTVKYAQGLIFYMKNRHSWKDKSEIEHSRKVDDLVKDEENEANRVNWQDITGANAQQGEIIDAQVIEDNEENEAST